MTRSSYPLAIFESLIADILLDAAHATFPAATLDSALAQALGEYSRASIVPGARIAPNLAVGTFTPAAGVRETNIYSQAWMRNYLDVVDVWYPYVDATSEPAPIAFELIPAGGTALLRFRDLSGDGSSVARVFARLAHTIKDLGDESTTTVAAGDEPMLARGAAALAVLSRTAGIAEDTNLTIWTVPNYRYLAGEWLAAFRAWLAPARVARQRPFQIQEVRPWSPKTLS